MSSLLAVDPGIRGCGVAFFVNESLWEAHYIANPITWGNDAVAVLAMANAIYSRFTAAGQLVCEWPQVYVLGQRGADPNDLLPLAGIDGALFGFYSRTGTQPQRFLPREWKGQLDPNACARRILGRLSPRELTNAQIPPSFMERLASTKSVKATSDLTHNIVDAIGIGLCALGRFDRKRNIEVGGIS